MAPARRQPPHFPARLRHQPNQSARQHESALNPPYMRTSTSTSSFSTPSGVP
ncbi:hypothetical protein FA95DRAFT_648684 [Auriscalpium vulgare]|uniref:Uncharacterized protein n=1 Tax=Auriscalpium vulgare TaxID=40419 RepID=A0ACB8RCS2_9AGAM|nr:hypothetical protein FA95DRAFT_648684 [Auriscalpium vulgare]